VDRRFVLFLVLSLLIWTTYLAVRFLMPPPAPPVAAQNDAAGEQGAIDKGAKDKGAKDKGAGDKGGEKPADPAVDPVKPAVPVVTTARKKVALGDLDKSKSGQMLVTFDSLGAAIERVELKRYRDVEDTSGYLGHLDLTEAPRGGAVVNVVGAGTPAAEATPSDNSAGVGLKVGDVITKANGQPVEVANFETWLKKNTRPEQRIVLTVERTGLAKPVEYTALLRRRPLEVVKPENHVYPTPEGGVDVLPTDPLSLLLSLDAVGPQSIRAGASEIAGLPSLLKSNWEIDDQGENFVQFSFTLDDAALKAIDRTGGLKIVKRYELATSDKENDPANYHVNLRIEIQNLGKETETVAYRLQGPTGLPLEGWWYSTKLHPEWFAGAGARDVVWSVGNDHNLVGCPLIVSNAKERIEENEPPKYDLLKGDVAVAIDYAGGDTQFFASAILPQDISPTEPLKFSHADALPVQDVMAVPKNRIRTVNTSVLLVSDVWHVAPGESLKHEYKVFFGPKDPTVLGEYGLGSLIEYGWPIFRLPAQGLGYVLHGLHWLVRNYGIAIILLTVIVRSCMVPVSLRQAKSAAMMQQLAPEVQKVKDKFPDDPVKQHAAVQELYKKHNFNPFGGCLLVFIQLPIFIGLYRCLSVDINLRDASLFPAFSWITWASNLAGPDKLFRWPEWMPAFIADEAAGWLGPFFNVLPLITVALFLVQQKLFTPPATDEQTKMQQQMMTYMTVFMGVMFYKVPAGLCLYFITSSLWGICERKMLPKPKPPGEGSAADVKPKATSTNGSAKTVTVKPNKPKR
jgi:YidC/Oxa1 family membrane protein insertase